MNKSEMAAKLAKKCDLNSKAEAERIVDAVFGIIGDEISQPGGEVRLSGFGTFCTVRSKARKGRNPSTGEEIDIEAKNSAKFKPASGLKNRLNP